MRQQHLANLKCRLVQFRGTSKESIAVAPVITMSYPSLSCFLLLRETCSQIFWIISNIIQTLPTYSLCSRPRFSEYLDVWGLGQLLYYLSVHACFYRVLGESIISCMKPTNPLKRPSPPSFYSSFRKPWNWSVLNGVQIKETLVVKHIKQSCKMKLGYDCLLLLICILQPLNSE